MLAFFSVRARCAPNFQNTHKMKKKQSESGDDQKFSYHQIEEAMAGHLLHTAKEMRETLKLSEGQFQIMSRAHNSRGRTHYIYGALDEIERVGMHLTATKDDLKEPIVPTAFDDTEKKADPKHAIFGRARAVPLPSIFD